MQDPVRVFVADVDIYEGGGEESVVEEGLVSGWLWAGYKHSAYSLRGLSGFSEYVDMAEAVPGRYQGVSNGMELEHCWISLLDAGRGSGGDSGGSRC